MTYTIAAKNVSADIFAFAPTYSSWISHDIMGWELVRNMLLAAVCVFVVVLLLIACLQSCVLVLMCVALTLVSLRGTLYHVLHLARTVRQGG
jgi:hypothetical protein